MEARHDGSTRGRSRLRTSAAIAAAALALVGLLATRVGAAGAAPSGASGDCTGLAWPTISDVTTGNAFFPDTNATYWLTPYDLAAGEALIVRGVRPFARYSSLTTYTSSGSPVDHVYDTELTPSSGGAYTEAISTTIAPGSGQAGTIAAGTSVGAASGSVALRIYLANDPNDPKGGEALPTLAVRAADGTERTLAPCPDPTGSVPANGLRIPVAASSTVTFTRTTSAGGFTNPDNAYLSAPVKASPGRVVLLEGKAPTFPNTRAGQPITGTEDVRYWSVCTNAMRWPLPVTACDADQSLPLDAQGDYHVVVSRPADKPATLAPGTVWLPWDTGSDLALILRNMLPSASFPYAAQSVPKGSSDLSSMGAYAPHAVLCTRALYERNRCPQP
jgi:hypothetical protein